MRGFTYLFAALLMAGGLAAFVRRGSVKSLLFSAAAAILLLISASVMHRRVGTLLALGEWPPRPTECAGLCLLVSARCFVRGPFACQQLHQLLRRSAGAWLSLPHRCLRFVPLSAQRASSH